VVIVGLEAIKIPQVFIMLCESLRRCKIPTTFIVGANNAIAVVNVVGVLVIIHDELTAFNVLLGCILP